MCDLIKTNIGDRQCLSGILPVVGASKLLRFGNRLLEPDGFTLLARIRASNSSRLNWSKDLLLLCDFPFWQMWRRYRVQTLILVILVRCQNIFWYQRFVFHGIWCNDSNMSARPTPIILLLYCWTIWRHGMFFSPSPFHTSFPTPQSA